eukprot:TRINITY_DN6095_c0_g2_i5.p1 TRINITY_DN6095_c0_g2~~TRINITY_DN6095_c0_g2_i5.p1  ORF type:complete len:114 (-),score=23.26 TRINITY_DN6095_c0_g2_i5:767-1108(-)
MMNKNGMMMMMVMMMMVIGTSMCFQMDPLAGRTIASGGRRTERLMEKLNAAEDKDGFMKNVVDPSWEGGLFKGQVREGLWEGVRWKEGGNEMGGREGVGRKNVCFFLLTICVY